MTTAAPNESVAAVVRRLLRGCRRIEEGYAVDAPEWQAWNRELVRGRRVAGCSLLTS